jgi:HEAT repeat protein
MRCSVNRGDSPFDLDQLLVELDDPDPLVRQEAAIALGDFCPKNHPAVNVLIERLRSTDQTPHDRACAAWALGRIGAKASKVIPVLLSVIEETRDQTEADELRSYAAEAIVNLIGEMDVLLKLAQHCLVDRFSKCRMNGLLLVERLLTRQSDLRQGFVPLIEALLKDEVEEIREKALRLVIGFEEDE